MFLTEGQNENNSQGKPDDVCSFLFIAFAMWQQISKGGKEASTRALDLKLRNFKKHFPMVFKKRMHPTMFPDHPTQL